MKYTCHEKNWGTPLNRIRQTRFIGPSTEGSELADCLLTHHYKWCWDHCNVLVIYNFIFISVFFASLR